jgi:hypothetical protein
VAWVRKIRGDSWGKVPAGQVPRSNCTFTAGREARRMIRQSPRLCLWAASAVSLQRWEYRGVEGWDSGAGGCWWVQLSGQYCESAGKTPRRCLHVDVPGTSGLRADLRREIDWWENQKAALGTLEQI